MKTKVNEIADGIYRISTLVPDIGPTGFTFNQFLVRAEDSSWSGPRSRCSSTPNPGPHARLLVHGGLRHGAAVPRQRL